MRAAWLVLLVGAALASGCTAGEGTNPNLAAPKLVLQPRSDGSVIVFVHSAFGERVYDWIALRADNETIDNRTSAFSLEEIVNRSGFYLDATAGTQTQMYTLRARIDVDIAEERALVAFHHDDGEWDDAQSFGLPFERPMSRRASE